MIKFNIEAQTELVKEGFINFVSNYRETFAEQLNTMLTHAGEQSDVAIEFSNGQLQIFQFAPDKGYVLGEVEGDLPIQLVQYSSLSEGQKYVVPTGDRLILFLKKSKERPDVKLGAFKSINDVVKDFNSEGVKQAIAAWEQKEKAEEKDRKRAEKLGKIKQLPAPKEAESVQIENEQ